MEHNTRTVKSKQCPKCNRTKSISEFTKDKSKKSGVASWCKKCKCATTFMERIVLKLTGGKRPFVG